MAPLDEIRQCAELFSAMADILEDRAEALGRAARDDRRLVVLMRDVCSILKDGTLSAPLGALSTNGLRTVRRDMADELASRRREFIEEQAEPVVEGGGGGSGELGDDR